MADELRLARKTLKVLRGAFAGAAWRHNQCFCRWIVAEDGYSDRLAGQTNTEWPTDSIIGTDSFTVKEADIRFVSEEEYDQILQENPQATFEKNSAGDEVYYREPGISSKIHYRGDWEGRREFETLSRDAAFCFTPANNAIVDARLRS